jgi:hypothetical protein
MCRPFQYLSHRLDVRRQKSEALWLRGYSTLFYLFGFIINSGTNITHSQTGNDQTQRND